jgi:hypothetical protein
MPTTVVAAGAAVAQVEWHGGVQVDVVAIGGRSVSEGGPSLEARGGGGAGGGGPRHWLRTVRSIGVGFNRGGADVLRTYLVVRVSVLPSWGLRGARRNRSRILRAARRAVCRRSAWPASLQEVGLAGQSSVQLLSDALQTVWRRWYPLVLATCKCWQSQLEVPAFGMASGLLCELGGSSVRMGIEGCTPLERGLS